MALLTFPVCSAICSETRSTLPTATDIRKKTNKKEILNMNEWIDHPLLKNMDPLKEASVLKHRRKEVSPDCQKASWALAFWIP